jgi:hypothetical protein
MPSPQTQLASRVTPRPRSSVNTRGVASGSRVSPGSHNLGHGSLSFAQRPNDATELGQSARLTA